MRLIKVSAPAGTAERIAELAFSAGIKTVSIQQAQELSADGKRETKDAVDMQTSTPKAKRFMDSLLAADFYNTEDFTLNVRAPRTIISSKSLKELTRPFVEPITDVYQELWQFSHITLSFVVRIFVASCLLAYGLIEQKTLIIIAGLLFLPLLPLLLAISFGIKTKNFRLVGQGALAFLLATVLLYAGGAAVASFSSPPLKYDEFNTLLVGALISLGVGIGGAFANTDDAGTRALIGLAATAQIAIVPNWFGISTVFGFAQSQEKIIERGISFPVNFGVIIVAALLAYFFLGMKSRSLPRAD